MTNFEFADFLIWGALAIIILRFLLPRLLEWLDMPVTKKPRDDVQE